MHHKKPPTQNTAEPVTERERSAGIWLLTQEGRIRGALFTPKLPDEKGKVLLPRYHEIEHRKRIES